MTTTRTTTKPVAKFLAENAVAGTVDHDHPQIIRFTCHNGRTGMLYVKDNGGFDGGSLFRGEYCLGHYSTLARLARAAQS